MNWKNCGLQEKYWIFDFVLMMDVLEHIEDDAGFLVYLKRYLKQDTVLVITVPAFQSLFSLHDRELHHFRRYSYKSLKEILQKSGYQIMDWSYFYLSLIFLRFLTMNRTQNLGMWNKKETDWVTRWVRKFLNIDFKVLRFLSRHRIHIAGLSLFMVCSCKDKNSKLEFQYEKQE